jgi:hypothetical protein
VITPFAPHSLPKLMPEDVAEIRDNYFLLHPELFPARAKDFTRIMKGTPRHPRRLCCGRSGSAGAGSPVSTKAIRVSAYKDCRLPRSTEGFGTLRRNLKHACLGRK